MHRRPYPSFFRLVLALMLVAGCASTDTMSLQRLDPETGVTITRASSPIILYRNRSAQSAFGRDYVFIGPIQVNNMGRREYFLWLGIWGTSDEVDRGHKMDDFESVVLYADGEPLSLEVKGWTPGAIGASSSVYVQPVGSALDGYYRVTIDQMRLIAESRDLELRAGSMQPQRYIPWDTPGSGTEPISAFLQQVY